MTINFKKRENRKAKPIASVIEHRRVTNRYIYDIQREEPLDADILKTFAGR